MWDFPRYSIIVDFQIILFMARREILLDVNMWNLLRHILWPSMLFNLKLSCALLSTYVYSILKLLVAVFYKCEFSQHDWWCLKTFSLSLLVPWWGNLDYCVSNFVNHFYLPSLSHWVLISSSILCNPRI